MSACAGSRSLLGIAWVAISLAAAPAGAEWFRLSEGQAFSDVGPFADRFHVSPDGRWAVYTHDAETDGVYDLWSVPLPSGPPVKLTGALPAPGVSRFAVSPDSSRVVYRADQDAIGVHELYSVPIGGPASARVNLNGSLVAGGDVIEESPSFAISPDGARVVYRADQQIDGVIELYGVPITGPASSGVKLNGTQVAGGDVANFRISSTSARVVYRADQQTDSVDELFSVPIAGPASSGVQLSGAEAPVRRGFLISPNGARVVYTAVEQTALVAELFSVPIAGPASSRVKLNGPLVAGGEVSDTLQISPSGARVVYHADQQTGNVFELYSVPIAGPATSGVKLNATLVAGGDVAESFEISPNGARVVYHADQQTDEAFELFSVPIAGPASSGFKLSGPLVANGEIESFTVSPDSAWAVYAADQEIDGWLMGYRAPLTGPAGSDERIWATAVNVPSDFAILPDSSAIVVRGNSAFVDGIVRLWTYPLAGTPDVFGTDWLGSEFQPNGDALSFRLLPDGSGAVYVADQEVNDQFELYLLYFRLWGDGFETGDTSRWSDTVP